MKLNPDCVRNVLLKIEEEHKIHIDDDNDVTFEPVWLETLYNAFPGTPKEDIFYTLFNLEQAGYVCSNLLDENTASEMYAVNYITFSGHEFLERIRNEKNWNAAKGILAAVRNYSLDAINQAANGIATAAITAALSQMDLKTGLPIIRL